MLLNEAKFLGPKFMAIRWLLTVIAIIVFSWITAKMIKDKDIPGEVLTQTGLHINREACMSCTLCVKHYPQVFKMENNKAVVKPYDVLDMEKLEDAINACPVKAITYNENKEAEQ